MLYKILSEVNDANNLYYAIEASYSIRQFPNHTVIIQSDKELTLNNVYSLFPHNEFIDGYYVRATNANPI